MLAQPRAAVESTFRRLMTRSISNLFRTEKPSVIYGALWQRAISINIKRSLTEVGAGRTVGPKGIGFSSNGRQPRPCSCFVDPHVALRTRRRRGRSMAKAAALTARRLTPGESRASANSGPGTAGRSDATAGACNRQSQSRLPRRRRSPAARWARLAGDASLPPPLLRAFPIDRLHRELGLGCEPNGRRHIGRRYGAAAGRADADRPSQPPDRPGCRHLVRACAADSICSRRSGRGVGHLDGLRRWRERRCSELDSLASRFVRESRS